jgi:hypothetical protein
MIIDVKQSIIDRLRATLRDNIETVIGYMEKNGFFTYHCHKHHKKYGGRSRLTNLPNSIEIRCRAMGK